MKRHTRITLIILILLSLGGLLLAQGNYVPPSGSPLANHEHPRLFLTNGELPAIRSYISTHVSSDFQSFINDCDAAYSEAASGKDKNYLLLDALNYAFLYLVDPGQMGGFSFGHSRSDYANKAWEHAQEIFTKDWTDTHNSYAFRSNNDGGYINMSLAVMYDWIYPYWSLAQKQALADKLIDRFDNLRNSATPGQHPVLSNEVINQAHGGTFGGLAIYGDNLGSTYDAKAQDMLNYMRDMWFERVFKTANHIFEGSSGWGEGPTYMFLSMFGANIMTHAISSATAQNWFYDCTQFRYHAWYLYASINPQAMTDYNNNALQYYMTRSNSCSLPGAGGNSYGYLLIPLIANLKSADPDMASLAKWLLRDSPYMVSENYVNTMPRLFHVIFKYLWRIEDVQSKSPQQIALPLANRFGLGETVMRSDHSTDATRLIFYTPKYYYTPHKSMDMSSFVLEKFGNLLVDAGVGKGQTNMPKSMKTGSPLYMNMMAAYDPNDPTYEDNLVYEYDFRLIGIGDVYSDPELQPGGSYHIGNLTGMNINNGDYEYVNYDYTRSHSRSTRVTGANRELMYIHGSTNNEYLLTYDRFSVGDGNFKKRYLLRPSFPPTLVDGSWTQIGPYHRESTDASIMEIDNTHGEAHGKLFVKVLEPVNYKIIQRGGDPDHWFLDAEGNDLAEHGPFLDWGAYWSSKCRIEVEAAGNNTSEDFLHVMQFGDANSLQTMASVTKIDVTNFVGALINGDRLVLFNKTGSPKTSANYTISTSGSVKHMVTGLEPGIYQVDRDGSSIGGTIEVTPDGVLFFEYSGGGTFQATQVGTSIDDDPAQVPQKVMLDQNFPNPFNPATTIRFRLDTSAHVQLNVYDVNGREVGSLVNAPLSAGEHQARWNGTDKQGRPVGSGIYLYRLKADDVMEAREMLLIR